MSKQKIIVILGPTSTGKSNLAVNLAKKFNGEIISADSRQVYRGMDLGTGKITKEEMQGIKHYLLDVAAPTNTKFNVTKFKTLADKKIVEISKRGKLPILAGGTGFWIDAVTLNQTFPDVKSDSKLRMKLLQKLSPERATNIDSKNKVRLIRAIEIAKGLKGKKHFPKITSNPKYSVLYIGLDLPTEKLYKNIDFRLLQRIKKGMLKEITRLHKQGVSWKRLEDFGLEYRYVARFLQKKISKEQMLTELSYAIKHYAKRQRTWFKRNKEIHWLDAGEKNASLKEASVLVKRFI